MTPEKVVQDAIYDYFKQLQEDGRPALVERRQAGGYNYKMGIPDLYAVYNGYHIEIEVKAPGGHLRTMQEKYRDKCKRLNIRWMCADSLEYCKQQLEAWFNEKFD